VSPARTGTTTIKEMPEHGVPKMQIAAVQRLGSKTPGARSVGTAAAQERCRVNGAYRRLSVGLRQVQVSAVWHRE
jgi:hypothetical protein